MNSHDSLVLHCKTTEEMLQNMNKLVKHLPYSVGRKFVKSAIRHIVSDFENAHQYVDGKTVTEILRDADKTEPSTISSGEIDGMQFTLFSEEDKKAK